MTDSQRKDVSTTKTPSDQNEDSNKELRLAYKACLEFCNAMSVFWRRCENLAPILSQIKFSNNTEQAYYSNFVENINKIKDVFAGLPKHEELTSVSEEQLLGIIDTIFKMTEKNVTEKDKTVKNIFAENIKANIYCSGIWGELQGSKEINKINAKFDQIKGDATNTTLNSCLIEPSTFLMKYTLPLNEAIKFLKVCKIDDNLKAKVQERLGRIKGYIGDFNNRWLGNVKILDMCDVKIKELKSAIFKTADQKTKLARLEVYRNRIANDITRNVVSVADKAKDSVEITNKGREESLNPLDIIDEMLSDAAITEKTRFGKSKDKEQNKSSTAKKLEQLRESIKAEEVISAGQRKAAEVDKERQEKEAEIIRGQARRASAIESGTEIPSSLSSSRLSISQVASSENGTVETPDELSLSTPPLPKEEAPSHLSEGGTSAVLNVNEEVKGLRNKNTLMQGVIAEFESKLSGASKQIDGLEKDNIGLKKVIEKVRYENGKFKIVQVQLETEVKASQDAVAKEQKINQANQVELGKLNSLVQELKQRVSTSRGSYESILGELKNENRSLKDQVNDLTEKYKSSEGVLIKELEETRAMLKEEPQFEGNNAQISALQQRIRTLEAEISRIKQEHQQEISRLKASFERPSMQASPQASEKESKMQAPLGQSISKEEFEDRKNLISTSSLFNQPKQAQTKAEQARPEIDREKQAKDLIEGLEKYIVEYPWPLRNKTGLFGGSTVQYEGKKIPVPTRVAEQWAAIMKAKSGTSDFVTALTQVTSIAKNASENSHLLRSKDVTQSYYEKCSNKVGLMELLSTVSKAKLKQNPDK